MLSVETNGFLSKMAHWQQEIAFRKRALGNFHSQRSQRWWLARPFSCKAGSKGRMLRKHPADGCCGDTDFHTHKRCHSTVLFVEHLLGNALSGYNFNSFSSGSQRISRQRRAVRDGGPHAGHGKQVWNGLCIICGSVSVQKNLKHAKARHLRISGHFRQNFKACYLYFRVPKDIASSSKDNSNDVVDGEAKPTKKKRHHRKKAKGKSRWVGGVG